MSRQSLQYASLFSAYKVGHVYKVSLLDSFDNARNAHTVVRDVNLARGVRAGVERADVGGTALAAFPLVDFLNHTVGLKLVAPPCGRLCTDAENVD